MLRWFKKFLKSDNAVIELIQFLVIWALWGVVAFVFPIGIIAKFVSLFPAMFPLGALPVIAISTALSFVWLSGWLRTWALLDRYKRSSLPPSDNDHQGGQKRLSAAMVKIEDLLCRFEEQFEKASIYLKRVLYEPRLLFSGPNPRFTRARFLLHKTG